MEQIPGQPISGGTMMSPKLNPIPPRPTPPPPHPNPIPTPPPVPTPIPSSSIGLKQPQPGKKSGILIKVIIAVIVLAIVGVGTSLAMRIWDPVWNPFRPDPEKITALMMEKMIAIKSAHSEAKIDLDVNSQDSMAATITFSGDWDKDVNNPRIQGDYGISLINGVGASVTVNSAKFNVKMVSLSEGYFNIGEVNAPSVEPLLMMMGIDLNSVIGSWIKIPITQFSYNQFLQNDNAQRAVLAEQIKRILSENKFYAVKKQLSNQIIGGQKMYHYLVALDNNKVASLVEALASEAMKQYGQESLTSLPDGAIEGMVSEFLNKIGEINAELSIGMKDNFLYGFKLDKSIDLAKITGDQEGVVGLGIEITNSKFDQPIAVEAPVIFKEFEEAFPQYRNLKIESSMAELNNEMNLMYMKDGAYTNVSCQNDSIKPYCDEIKAISGNEVIINKSKNYYCAYVKLPSLISDSAMECSPGLKCVDEVRYFCMDILGASHETTINPGNKGYCSGKIYKCP
ncbi:hypothetical protein KJ786_02750 [Patescibacteria group bacterium]|nr:hypothetical protein [Patescibacteria group bacterium]